MIKAFLVAVIFVVGWQQLAGQSSVGVGTSTPDGSAALDVYSVNKGLLIPRVALQSTGDGSTIALPAVGLMVYNTNSLLSRGTGIYFNNGVPAFPSWTKANELTFPFSRFTSDDAISFDIQNYSASASSGALRGYSLGGTGVYASSSSGYAL